MFLCAVFKVTSILVCPACFELSESLAELEVPDGSRGAVGGTRNERTLEAYLGRPSSARS